MIVWEFFNYLLIFISFLNEPVAKPLVLQFARGAKLRRIRHRKRSKHPTEDRLVRQGTKAANAALELSPHLAGLMASAQLLINQ
jgi:hypothetical protein